MNVYVSYELIQLNLIHTYKGVTRRSDDEPHEWVPMHRYRTAYLKANYPYEFMMAKERILDCNTQATP